MIPSRTRLLLTLQVDRPRILTTIPTAPTSRRRQAQPQILERRLRRTTRPTTRPRLAPLLHHSPTAMAPGKHPTSTRRRQGGQMRM
jgi:hypothetical protein